jgi:hypothetical protein
VAELIEVPLSTLFDPNVVKREQWTLRGTQVEVRSSRSDRKVWGDGDDFEQVQDDLETMIPMADTPHVHGFNQLRYWLWWTATIGGWIIGYLINNFIIAAFNSRKRR